MPTVEEILQGALALPRAERSAIAVRLISSLESEEQGSREAEWLQEIERRVARVRTGGSDGTDAQEVHARIRAALARD